MLQLHPTWVDTCATKKLVEWDIQIKISGIWTPALQRNHDRIIMDLVLKNLPDWMWNSINLCRLYLQAVTISDITTFMGTTIPREVYEVRAPYRKSTLLFPMTSRPSREHRLHWQYFIRYITRDSVELFTPLTTWIRNPSQTFPYAWDYVNDLIYRNVTTNTWELYFPQENKRNTYVQANLTRRALPSQWRPIQIIMLSKNTI